MEEKSGKSGVLRWHPAFFAGIQIEFAEERTRLYFESVHQLSIDDYYKVCGYACFYKSDVVEVNSISALEITLTFVCKSYPYRLMKHLQEERGLHIEKQEAGIYCIQGDVFPVQLLVTSRLSSERGIFRRENC